MVRRRKKELETFAEKITQWIGSVDSLIVHTVLFMVAFMIPILHFSTFEQMLLVLTTLVSLEAIYLSIFIQMSVNKNTEDIEIIQEDIDEIQEDIDEIQEDIDEIQEDVEEIQEDIEEIYVEEVEESTPQSSFPVPKYDPDKLQHIQDMLEKLQQEIELLKRK